MTACFYAYWSDVSLDSLEIYARSGRAAIAFPTHSDQTVVLVDWPRSEYPEFRSDIEGNYLRTLDLFPELSERVRAGQRTSRVLGTAELPNFFRRPYGTGWALVGDAGYHKDPITLQGMTDAFRDAELLARAIDAAYGGTRPLESALMQYERERNEAALPKYSLTQSMASLRMPPPETPRMMEALQSNPVQADRFFGTLTGSVPMDEFFSRENVERILASAES